MVKLTLALTLGNFMITEIVHVPLLQEGLYQRYFLINFRKFSELLFDEKLGAVACLTTYVK